MAIIGGSAAAFAEPLSNTKSVGVVFSCDIGGKPYGGLQYQMWLSPKWGFSIEGFGYYADVFLFNESKGWYNINVDLNYLVCEYSDGRKTGNKLFLWSKLGNSGTLSQATNSDDSKTDIIYKSNVVFGVGFTVDMYFADHLSIPIIVGGIMQAPNDPSFNLALGTGLRFAF